MAGARRFAAASRLVALYGWDDLIFTHVSARVPGAEHHFLLNPYGMMFDEVTASSLVKIDLTGNKVMESPYFINPAASPFIAPCMLRVKTPFASCTYTRIMASQFRPRRMVYCRFRSSRCSRCLRWPITITRDWR